MTQFLAYLQFLYHSKNQHGVHSPYVYDLLTKCLYRKPPKDAWVKYKEFRKSILNATEKIQEKNLGAPSRKLKTELTKIPKIARVAGSSKSEAKFLLKLSHYLQPKNTLELGTSLGLGTSALAMGTSKQASITTVEGDKEKSDYANDQFKKFELNNIVSVNSSFDQALEKLNNELFDLIYIDGNHTYQATMNYFRWSLEHSPDEGVIIFDDIYWSKEMKRAWKEIQEDNNINLSIDFYSFGYISKRPGQRKEHFILRA
ncbi:MAG: O-methyltransferase [Flavobacteriaceae bacterium]